MFMPLVRKRRSIRKFLDRSVEPEKLSVLVEAALRAPSSRGVNPWQFVVVADRGTLASLAQAKEHGSAFLAGAPLGIVVCADPKKSDVWVEDASIAATMIQLAAESLDLGSCWIQIRERMHDRQRTAESYVAELMVLAPGLRVVCIVAIGYPDEAKPPQPDDKLLYSQVHRERFGKSFR